MTAAMRRLLAFLPPVIALASCVSAPPPSPPPPRPPAPPTPALPAAPPQQDWRDVPLTPGRWTWQGAPGTLSLSRFGVPGQPPSFTVRCDFGGRSVLFSGATTGAAVMTLTTSFGAFTLPAAGGAARLAARDPRLDQLAFSRGRFTVDIAGQPQLVLPAWPEVARVIEDCRG